MELSIDYKLFLYSKLFEHSPVYSFIATQSIMKTSLTYINEEFDKPICKKLLLKLKSKIGNGYSIRMCMDSWEIVSKKHVIG